MVNTGGRSRACSTCRRRRVKCDEIRPICRRCERCGFECSGAKAMTFIDQGELLKTRRAAQETSYLKRHDPEERNRTIRKVTLPTLVSLKAFEIRTYICYAKKYLLRGGPVHLTLETLHLSDICAAGENTSDTQILHRAILSLATIFFGSQHRQSSIKDSGYAMLGVTLKQLNYALSDPKCYTRDDVLLSVATLALLECFIPTGLKYCFKHISGLEKLLELRGPITHYSENSWEIYRGLCRMILFASLSTRTSSILARNEWKRSPWTTYPEQKTEEQYLLHILADCTVLMAAHDKLNSNSEPGIQDFRYQQDKIFQTALDLLKQLYARKMQWDTDTRNNHIEIPAVYTESQATQETCENMVAPVPTIFIFTNNSAVTMLMLYNMTLIFILQVFAPLSERTSTINCSNQHTKEPSMVDSELSNYPSNYVTKDENTTVEQRSAALDICRCIQYHLQHISHLDTGSLTIAHLAIRTAYTILGGNGSPTGRWIMNLLNIEDSKVFPKGLWVD